MSSETSPELIGADALAGKYLTFRLGKESYGIPVLKVREIIKLVPITAVPHMPDHVKGVLNLRGKIIPVVDLRTKFGLEKPQTTERTCIVVVQLSVDGQAGIQMGLIVDGVEEVANIASRDIEQTPDFGTTVDTAYILGMAKLKDAVKTLLDIDKAITADAIKSFSTH